jgi:hypothetical protein
MLVLAFVLAACGGDDQDKKEPESQPADATLTVEQDRVEVRAGGGETWAQAANAQAVRSEDAIRTDSTGRALLNFYTGTEVEILPDSELVVTSFEETADGGHTITLSQLSGETLHRVERIADREDRYELNTPSAHIVVRGTVFGVEVAPDGATTIEVREGVVQAQAGQQTVEVQAGEALDIAADQTIPGTPYPIPAIRPPAATPAPTQTPAPTSASTQTGASRSDVPLAALLPGERAAPAWRPEIAVILAV